MATFQSIFFLIFGIGLVGVAWRSLSTGWLPCGPNGFKGRLQIEREAQPLFYWVLFASYTAAGLALTVFAVRLLAGWAAPLPLR